MKTLLTILFFCSSFQFNASQEGNVLRLEKAAKQPLKLANVIVGANFFENYEANEIISWSYYQVTV